MRVPSSFDILKNTAWYSERVLNEVAMFFLSNPPNDNSDYRLVSLPYQPTTLIFNGQAN
jgi:hypothetical protein